MDILTRISPNPVTKLYTKLPRENNFTPTDHLRNVVTILKSNCPVGGGGPPPPPPPPTQKTKKKN